MTCASSWRGVFRRVDRRGSVRVFEGGRGKLRQATPRHLQE